MIFFLKISRTRLFILLFGIPILGIFVIPESVMLSEGIEGYLVPGIGFLYVFIMFMLWIWTVGNHLFHAVTESIASRQDYRLFKAALWVLIIDVLLAMAAVISAGMKTDIPSLGLFLIIFQLASIVSLGYAAAFNAKYLKMGETGRKVNKEEYIGDAGLFIAYPIGVWFIQPRINRIFDKR